MFAKLSGAPAAAALVLGLGSAQAAEPVLHLKSTPETVVRGYISAERKPVLTIKSGQTVEIDTISHTGLSPDPVTFFGAAGIPKEQVLQDAIDAASCRPSPASAATC